MSFPSQYQSRRGLDPKREIHILDRSTGCPFAKIIKYVTDYSVETAQKQFNAWRDLEVELLVKYMDGNVKPQDADGKFIHSQHSEGLPEHIEHPGYTELWKETVAQEHGEIIRVP